MKPKTVTIGTRTFTLPYAHMLRPLTHEERKALKESIRTEGVLVPVIVDEEDNVIDGANRLTLAAECKIRNVRTEVFRDLQESSKAALAVSLNECRRNLTVEEWKALQNDKDQLVAKTIELREKGMSEHAIAEEVGASRSTVHRLLSSSTDATCPDEQVASPHQTTGQDGRVYASPELRKTREARVVELSNQGLSQRAIAREVGIAQSHVSRILKESLFASADDEPNEPQPETASPGETVAEIVAAESDPDTRPRPPAIECGNEHPAIEPEPTPPIEAPADAEEWRRHMLHHFNQARQFANLLGWTFRAAVDWYDPH